MVGKRDSKQLAMAIALIALVSASAFAQPGGGRGRGGFGGANMTAVMGLMRNLQGPAQFAMRADVSKELGLEEEDIEELREVAQDFPRGRDLWSDLGIDFQSIGQMDEDEVTEMVADARKKIAEISDDAMDDVKKVLSSKQAKRLAELQFQYTALGRKEPATALRSADVDVDSDDEEKLKKAVGEVEAELAKKIAAMRSQMYIEAMAEAGISESKVESLMGELFVFTAQSPFGRGGGGRGGGAVGGGRQRGGGQQGGGGGGRSRRQRPSSGDGDEEEAPRSRRRGN